MFSSLLVHECRPAMRSWFLDVLSSIIRGAAVIPVSYPLSIPISLFIDRQSTIRPSAAVSLHTPRSSSMIFVPLTAYCFYTLKRGRGTLVECNQGPGCELGYCGEVYSVWLTTCCRKEKLGQWWRASPTKKRKIEEVEGDFTYAWLVRKLRDRGRVLACIWIRALGSGMCIIEADSNAWWTREKVRSEWGWSSSF